jgi:phycoerythrin-associated linker protein
VKRALSDGGDSAPMRGDLYVGFGLGQREQEVFARTPGDSPDLIQALIRATYRQVMGNPHLMESERNITAESKFAEGVSSTREFVRAIAMSAEYSRRFFASNAPYRFVELNFKHLLGRAPTSQAEVSEHIQRLATHGYEAEINSYVDSAEYQQTFGEDTIPYQRIATEAGRSQVAFNRHLSLAQGYAASDTVQSASSLVASVATNGVPSNWNSTTQRINRVAAASGTTEPTGKRYRIVVQAQPAGGRQRTPNASYLVSGKDMTSQLGYIHRRGGRIVSITEVI